jgi:hypothetical protein
LIGAWSRRGSRTVDGARRPSATSLRRILDELGAAKARLLEESTALREIEARVRAWDLREVFQARRGHALRAEGTDRFANALAGLEELLTRLARGEAAGLRRPRPWGGRTRPLLVEIHTELRYLQRAFDGGSLLLAGALASFSTQQQR